jgi:hypothetical protein
MSENPVQIFRLIISRCPLFFHCHSKQDFLHRIDLDLQGIVDPVDQIGQGYHHRQLNNLILGIVFAHIFQNRRVNCGRPARNNIGKTYDDFFFLVKGFAVSVKPQLFDLFVGNAGLLRRSSVGDGSIFAFIYDRCFQIGQLLVFGFYFALVHDRVVKLDKRFKSCRKSGYHPENIGYTADIF